MSPAHESRMQRRIGAKPSRSSARTFRRAFPSRAIDVCQNGDSVRRDCTLVTRSVFLLPRKRLRFGMIVLVFLEFFFVERIPLVNWITLKEVRDPVAEVLTCHIIQSCDPSKR